MSTDEETRRGPQYVYPPPASDRPKRKMPLVVLSVLLIGVLIAAGWYFTQNQKPPEDPNKPDLKGPPPSNFPGRPAPRAA